MSVVLPIEDDSRYRIYTATAAQTTFSVPFPFQDNGDISAFALNTTTLDFVEISSTLYTLTGAGNPSGGSLVFSTGRAVGDTILILGQTILERLSSIVRDGRFSSVLIDDELDRNRLIQQELYRDVKRAVKMQLGAGNGLIVQAGLEDGQTLIKQGNNLVAGPDVTTIEDAITFRNEAAASAAAASASQGSALASQIAAAASAAYAESLAGSFQTVRTLPYAGAVPRTLASVSQDRVDAREFGVNYDGSDEGAKLNAAIAALAGSSTKQLILTGRVSSSVQISVTPDDISILGAGGGSRRSGVIALNNDMVIMSVSGARCALDNVLLYGPAAPTSNNMGIYWSGTSGRIRDVDVINTYSGTAAQAAHDLHTHNLQNLTYQGFGFRSAGCVGGWHSKMRNVAGNAGDDTRGTLGNVRMVNQNESVNFTDMECLGGKYSFISATSGATLSNRTFACHFTNAFFDGATHGSLLNDLWGTTFTQCWFSGGREGNTSGAVVDRGRALSFSNCQFYNSGQAGIRVFNTTGLKILGGEAYDNGKSATGYGGVDLNAVNHFCIDGIETGNGIVGAYGPWPDGRQLYGVTVQSGCTNGRVKNVMNNGNLTGAVYAGATASSTMVYADNF